MNGGLFADCCALLFVPLGSLGGRIPSEEGRNTSCLLTQSYCSLKLMLMASGHVLGHTIDGLFKKQTKTSTDFLRWKRILVTEGRA